MSDSHTSKQLSSQPQNSNHKLNGASSNGAQVKAVKESPSTHTSSQLPSSFAANCDLYPKALRDVINGCSDGAVHGKRDPAIVQEAERCYQLNSRRQHQHAINNPEQLLCFYPGAGRFTSVPQH